MIRHQREQSLMEVVWVFPSTGIASTVESALHLCEMENICKPDRRDADGNPVTWGVTTQKEGYKEVRVWTRPLDVLRWAIAQKKCAEVIVIPATTFDSVMTHASISLDAMHRFLALHWERFVINMATPTVFVNILDLLWRSQRCSAPQMFLSGIRHIAPLLTSMWSPDWLYEYMGKFYTFEGTFDSTDVMDAYWRFLLFVDARVAMLRRLEYE